jgi:pimeloyl-ACP methyl ester carboxylesterase
MAGLVPAIDVFTGGEPARDMAEPARMKRMTVDGVEIAYLDRGSGPAVIVAHCSSASHKEWLPLIETLEPDWRVLAPDFIGYGQSEAWPETKVFTGRADLGVLLALADEAKEPVHLVGHSYGAAMALEAARVLGDKVRSLALVEPVSFNLLRVEERPEWAEVEELGRAVLSAVTEGNDREAAAAFMRYWLGRLRWWLSPESFKAAITATIHKVALEFMIAIEASTRLSDYASVTAPTLLVAGANTRAPTRAVVDMLGATLPNVEVKVIKGAGHMSPFTHPSEVNRLIVCHLAAQRQREPAPLQEA